MSHVRRAQGDVRPAGGEALAQPEARSLLESPCVFGDVHTVQVQVHMYTRIPGHEPPITPGRSVGRSCNSVHACLYVLYAYYASVTWTAETSIIDGRRLTAEDANTTCIPHTTHRIPLRLEGHPFRFHSRTGRDEENREQSGCVTHASAFRGCPPGPHSERY